MSDSNGVFMADTVCSERVNGLRFTQTFRVSVENQLINRERSRFLGSSMASPMKAELALVVPVAPAKCNTVVFVTK